MRGLFNQMSAAMVMVQGTANFFSPRYPPSWLNGDGTIEAPTVRIRLGCGR